MLYQMYINVPVTVQVANDISLIRFNFASIYFSTGFQLKTRALMSATSYKSFRPGANAERRTLAISTNKVCRKSIDAVAR